MAALTLLAGCDEQPKDSSSQSPSWINRIIGEKAPSPALPRIYTSGNFVRETQSGNYLAAQFAQYRQDWTTANDYLDKAIRFDPKNLDLQQRAMVLAMQAGDVSRALVLARKVLDQDADNTLALLFVGIDEIKQQKYTEAQTTLSKMEKNGIADFIRPILIAWSTAPEKTTDVESLIAAGPLQAYHALLIKDYLGKVSDPERYFITVLTGGGADAHILEMMGDVYARQGQAELAKKIYETLLLQGKDNPILMSRMEVIQEKMNNPEKAQASKILIPSEGAAEAFYNMARILFNDQSDDSALVFARLSQNLDPSNDDVRLLMASIMVRGNHTKEAIEFYNSIKEGSPEYKQAQRSAAELMEQAGKIDEAIAYLEKTYQVSRDANALIQIGDVYRRAERHTDAIKAYDRAAQTLGGKISSDYWHLLYARGMSYERVGNMKLAESDLLAALEFRPEHPYLLNYLGYSWADQGKKLDESLALIEKAVALKPDDGYIVDSLGWVFYKMGKYENAVAELEKAVELVPYDATINEHLGDSYWQVGRKNEARFQWQRAMNNSKDEKVKASLQTKISEGLATSTSPVMEAKTNKTNDVVKQ